MKRVYTALQADGAARAAFKRDRNPHAVTGIANSPLALETAIVGGHAALAVRPASKQTAASACKDMLCHQAPCCVRHLQAEYIYMCVYIHNELLKSLAQFRTGLAASVVHMQPVFRASVCMIILRMRYMPQLLCKGCLGLQGSSLEGSPWAPPGWARLSG